MRKIFKPEFIRRENKVVQIPDVEFEPYEPEPLIEEIPVENPINDTDSESGENTAAEGEAAENTDSEADAEAAGFVEHEPQQLIITEELREEIRNEIREELAGELGRKKIAAQKEINILIRDAKQEADAIIAHAKSESEQIMNDAAAKAQEMRTEAYTEGSKKGFEDRKQLLDNLAIYISNSIEEIKKERNLFFEEYAKQLKHLSIDICEKIISQRIDEDDMVMYGVIKDAVRYVRDTKWVKAEVASELSGYVDSLEKELQTSGQNVEFIFSDGIPKDSCILNTSNGLVIATVSEQIKNLREFINMLDKGDSDES